MDWSNETMLRFLDYYEEEPVLWNASHPNHKNRNDVHDAWRRIKQHMDDAYTVDELKKKKDSLMASFRTNLNKVKASIKSGASVDTIYKPNWFAYDRMVKFLRDKDEPRVTINTQVVQIDPQENAIEQADNPVEIENDGVVLPSTSKKQENNPTKRKQKTADEHDLKKKMDSAYSLLQASIHKPAPQKDMCDIYGELVAAKLRKMEECSRQLCMHRMDAVMLEMLMNPAFVTNPSPTFPTAFNQHMGLVTSPVSSVHSHSSYQQRSQSSPALSQSSLSQTFTPAPSPNDRIPTYTGSDITNYNPTFVTNQSVSNQQMRTFTSLTSPVQAHSSYQQESQQSPIVLPSPLSQIITTDPFPNDNASTYNGSDITNQIPQNIPNYNRTLIPNPSAALPVPFNHQTRMVTSPTSSVQTHSTYQQGSQPSVVPEP